MKSTIAILILFTLRTTGYSVPDTNSTNAKPYVLPWPVIAQKFGENALFCLKARAIDINDRLHAKQSFNPESVADYVIGIDECDATVPLTKIVSRQVLILDVNLAKWEHQEWRHFGHMAATIEPNGIRFNAAIKTEGFFKLDLTAIGTDGTAVRDEVYAIICSSWKREVLAYCNIQKEDCENRPDPELVRSSIVTSNFDNSMEIIGKTPTLSHCALDAFAKAIKSRQDFDAGKYPDLVIGLNRLRLKRFEGAPIEEIVVSIPSEQKGTKPFPVFLYADIGRWAALNNYSIHPGFVDIGWHTIEDKEIDWKSFCKFMEILKRKVSLDENRIYLNGECGNGIVTMSLALNHPDQWAEASASLGNACRHLAGNAFNLPVIFVKGMHNEEDLVGYYNFAVECFKFYGCRDFKYSKSNSISEVRGDAVPQAMRERKPLRVLYTMESLANAKAYWAKIEGREDENFSATIDAIAWGQTILIKTRNIDAYSLELSEAPIDINKPIEIIENGQSLGFIKGPSFSKKTEKYKSAAFIKNEHLSGPVADVFTDPYVVVWGDTGGNTQAETNKKIALFLAGSGPCFGDTNLPEKFINSHNLVVVGTPESNLWLKKINDKLPVQIEINKVLADGQSYEKTHVGVILIYPNPLNPAKYVAVFSGTSENSISNILNAYSQMKSKNPADVGIFEVTTTDQIAWLRMEKFDTVWNWHSQWNHVVADSKRTHPQWQWRQWLAETVRRQLNTDVAIVEDPFESDGFMPQGEIQFRELFGMFKNDWIVKIRLSGKTLRNLLTVPFKDIPSREVSVPVVAGVTLFKTPNAAKNKTVSINELTDDKEYTVALPYKAVNGKRMGLLINDYRIMGEGYVVLLLKNYLTSKAMLDLDTELDGMKLNIF